MTITRTRFRRTTSIDSDITRIIHRHGHPTHSEWDQHPSYQQINTTNDCSTLIIANCSSREHSPNKLKAAKIQDAR
jgi:hypothetical protein